MVRHDPALTAAAILAAATEGRSLTIVASSEAEARREFEAAKAILGRFVVDLRASS